jgi:hypothetical protein
MAGCWQRVLDSGEHSGRGECEEAVRRGVGAAGEWEVGSGHSVSHPPQLLGERSNLTFVEAALTAVDQPVGPAVRRIHPTQNAR